MLLSHHWFLAIHLVLWLDLYQAFSLNKPNLHHHHHHQVPSHISSPHHHSVRFKFNSAYSVFRKVGLDRHPFFAKNNVMTMMEARQPALQLSAQTQDVEAEVVGASGRIGSQLLRLLEGRVRAVPRGLCPGSWTSSSSSYLEQKFLDENNNKPIFVATPSATWKHIFQVTLPHRRHDLVWTGNGLLQPDSIFPQEQCAGDSTQSSSPTREEELDTIIRVMHKNATVVIAHYGILAFGSKPTAAAIGRGVPTYVYGRHADFTMTLLENDGISVEKVHDWQEIQLLAARKLVWASSLWLFCHAPHEAIVQNNNIKDKSASSQSMDQSSPAGSPISVSQVHEMYSAELKQLVQELWSILLKRIGVSDDGGVHVKYGDMNDTLAYMQQYSDLTPDVIPCLELAKLELKDRNGVFLQENQESQPFHVHLLNTVVGPTNTSSLLSEVKINECVAARCNDEACVVKLPGLNISVYGSKRGKSMEVDVSHPVVIVGGGIVGTSIAMNTARIGFRRVAVMDQQPPPPPPTQESTSTTAAVGETTPASWAWLNANQKSPPPSYQWLNQLGMLAWRQDPVVNELPLWNGSLVQMHKPVEDSKTVLVGYPCEGPLSRERLLELEPNCVFAQEYPTFYFCEEGCVDPTQAVQIMRRSAADNNVSFLFGHRAEALVRNNKGVIQGVSCRTEPEIGDGNTSISSNITVDASIVISAAGVGSQMPFLGGIPLLIKPGTIVLGKATTANSERPTEENGAAEQNSSNQRNMLLTRILVDAVHESHILQRRDGTLVIGGGCPQMGGKSAEGRETSTMNSTHLLSLAAQYIAPTVVSQMDPQSVKTEQAIRPMPKDGYPSIGFVDKGGNDNDEEVEGNSRMLYSAVTHSGITLAPLLGALIAAELFHNLDLELLRPWRPQRFDLQNQANSRL